MSSNANRSRDQRVILTGVTIHLMRAGQKVDQNLDPRLIQIVDRQTGAPLFNEVMDASIKTKETPDGPEVVHDPESGFSGIR